MAQTASRWSTIGRLLTLLGGIVVIAVTVQLGLGVISRPTATCSSASHGQPPRGSDSVYLPPGQILTVEGPICIGVQPKAYFKKAETSAPAATPAAPVTQTAPGGPGVSELTPKTFAIFIDGKKTPVTFSLAENAGWTWLPLKLRGESDAKKPGAMEWRDVLRGPTTDGLRKVQIGIGSPEETLPRAVAGEAELRVYWPWRVWALGLGQIALVGGAIIWGWSTGMLRDRAPSEVDKTPPFSLGRSQMAFWFLLTLAGYLYIWLVSGQSFNVVTEGVLVLLGISGTTGLAAMVVDEGSAAKPQSRGYWTDILSDGGNIVVHRLQMVAWTVVLGLIFAWFVVTEHRFPDFDTALLLLMGIAGGTYVGFKTREASPPLEAAPEANQAAAAAPVAPAAAPAAT